MQFIKFFLLHILVFIIATEVQINEKSHSEMESSVAYLISRVVASKIKRMCFNLNLSHQRRIEGRETAFPVCRSIFAI